MKFQCDRCKTRYSIADEKVRGKILKIRCKSCEAVITVRDGDAPRLAPETAGAPARQIPRAATHTIELRAVGRSSGSVPAASGPGTDPVTRLPELEGVPEEWYLSIDGKQVGPLSPDQAFARVAARTPGSEMHAWRDDFTEWLPVEDVPVLAVHLPRVKGRAGASPPAVLPVGAATPAPLVPAPPKNQAPPGFFGTDAAPATDPFAALRPDTPTGTPPPAPGSATASASDGFDFEIGEASRLVKLPILPPPASSSSRPAGTSALPGIDAAHRADESLKLRFATEPELPPLPPPGLSTSVVSARPRRRLLVPLVAAGLVAAAILGGLAFVGLRGDDEKAPAPAPPASQTVLVKDFYSRENPMFASGAAPRAAEAAAPEPEPEVVPKEPAPERPRAPATTAVRPRIVAPPPGATLDQPRILTPRRDGRREKTDTFDGSDEDSGPVTPDDVRAMYGANEVGLKRCYERALKSDPSSSVTKMVVKITIKPDGRVTDISVPNRGTELAECVAGNIKNWRFRRSSDELTTEFTVYFARRG